MGFEAVLQPAGGGDGCQGGNRPSLEIRPAAEDTQEKQGQDGAGEKADKGRGGFENIPYFGNDKQRHAHCQGPDDKREQAR